MALLQFQVDTNLKKAIQKRAQRYGVPASSLIRIILVKTFLEEDSNPGNVFNAKRDNGGRAIPLDHFIDSL